MTDTPARLVFTHPVAFLAYGLGSGLAPKAPGTFGTLAALPFLYLFALLPDWGWLVAIAITFLLGIYICGYTARRLGLEDPGGIVWDEFVGVWMTFWLIPLNLWTVPVGFVLFRVFDILKPWPIGWLDKKVKGGLGIMIDDLIAGVYAWLIMMIAVQFVN